MEALTRTEVALPCSACRSPSSDAARGLQADFVAGHSLGEYTAAVEDGIELAACADG